MSDDLKLRAQRKAKKPHFIRQNAHQNKEVGTKYRKPRGYQSKLRLGKSPRGLVLPSQGYRAPKSVRGTNPEGLYNVVVSTVKDLSSIDGKTQCVVISSTVGQKKKIALLEKVIEMKLPISIDAKVTLDGLQKAFEDQKSSRQKTESKREEKEAQAKAAENTADAKKAKKAATKPTTKKKATTVTKDTEDKKDAEEKKILTNKETAM